MCWETKQFIWLALLGGSGVKLTISPRYARMAQTGKGLRLVIQLRILRRGDYPGLSGWSPKCHHMYPYKSKAEGDVAHAEEKVWKRKEAAERFEDGSRVAPSRGMLAAARAERDAASGLWRKYSLTNTWILTQWHWIQTAPSKTERTCFCCLSHQVVVICITTNPGNSWSPSQSWKDEKCLLKPLAHNRLKSSDVTDLRRLAIALWQPGVPL